MPRLYKTEQDRWSVIYSAVFLALVVIFSYALGERNKAIGNISALDYIILFMATFRLVRLFVYDSVTEFLRKYFEEFKSGPGKTAADLLNCPWCTGIWMALIVLVIFFFVPHLSFLLLLLSLAGIGSIIQVIVWKIGKE